MATTNLRVRFKEATCNRTATPPPSAKDTVDVVIRSSPANDPGTTIGITMVGYMRFMKTREHKEPDYVHDVPNVGLEDDICISVMLMNNGARAPPETLRNLLRALDMQQKSTFRRPPEAAAVTVISGSALLGAAIVGACVGGPVGVVVGILAVPAVAGFKKLFKNHDGVMSYDSIVIKPRALPGEQVWTGRLNDERADYTFKYAVEG